MILALECHRQSSYALRLDWGLSGASAAAPACDVAAVVDVLSFTTSLTVAADRGVLVYPYPWQDDKAGTYAGERGATLAVGRSRAREEQVSLSPGSIRKAAHLERLVLPSPNGSTISFRLAEARANVIGVSLRNRSAAARWLQARRARQPQLQVAIIAAGEKWPDQSLRPAVEDLWGAGALISALRTSGWDDLSPEAAAAAHAFDAVADRIGRSLQDCASGRELIATGYRHDVETASKLDSSRTVPRLSGDAFVP